MAFNITQNRTAADVQEVQALAALIDPSFYETLCEYTRYMSDARFIERLRREAAKVHGEQHVLDIQHRFETARSRQLLAKQTVPVACSSGAGELAGRRTIRASAGWYTGFFVG